MLQHNLPAAANLHTKPPGIIIDQIHFILFQEDFPVHPIIEQLKSLSIDQKVQIVEELWDDIGSTAEPFPLPAWHREEAIRRGAEVDADPSIALTRDELWRRVQQSDEA